MLTFKTQLFYFQWLFSEITSRSKRFKVYKYLLFSIAYQVNHWRTRNNRKLKITSGRKRALNAGRKRAECRRPFFNLNLPYRSVTGIEFRILSQVCLSLYQVFLDDMHGRQTVIFSWQGQWNLKLWCLIVYSFTIAIATIASAVMCIAYMWTWIGLACRKSFMPAVRCCHVAEMNAY